MEPNREILDNEIEAIELGLNALAYGLRRTYMLALDTMAIVRSAKQGSEAEAIIKNLPAQNLAVIQYARRKIGELMETVGNYRNNTDCCSEREGQVTEVAYELMNTLTEHDREPLEQAEGAGDDCGFCCEQGDVGEDDVCRCACHGEQAEEKGEG